MDSDIYIYIYMKDKKEKKKIYRYDHPLGDREVGGGEKGSRLTAVWDLDLLFCRRLPFG